MSLFEEVFVEALTNATNRIFAPCNYTFGFGKEKKGSIIIMKSFIWSTMIIVHNYDLCQTSSSSLIEIMEPFMLKEDPIQVEFTNPHVIPEGFAKYRDRAIYGFILVRYRKDIYAEDGGKLLGRIVINQNFHCTTTMSEIAEKISCENKEPFYFIGFEKDMNTDEAVYDDQVLLSSIWGLDRVFVFANIPHHDDLK
jgi:hypothetical protein